MTSAEYDLGYLRAGVSELEDYLLSKEIYWTLDAKPPVGEPPYLRLTLGGLLLVQQRIRGWALNAMQSIEFVELEKMISDTAYRWHVAWGEKAAHEFHTGVNLWQVFLEETLADPEANFDRYSYEVRRRVILSLLSSQAIGITSVDMDQLDGLDRILRGEWVPGEFVWETQIAGGFPRDKFWYLYGKLIS